MATRFDIIIGYHGTIFEQAGGNIGDIITVITIPALLILGGLIILILSIATLRGQVITVEILIQRKWTFITAICLFILGLGVYYFPPKSPTGADSSAIVSSASNNPTLMNTVTLTPINEPTINLPPTPSETPSIAIPSITWTPLSSETPSITWTPTKPDNQPTIGDGGPTLACTEVKNFMITSPGNGITGFATTKTPIPLLPEPTVLMWEPAYCRMIVQIYVGSTLNHTFENALSGSITTIQIRDGIKSEVKGSVWIEIKIWVPGMGTQAANLHIRLPE
jgi:hypothetical protein